jgi:chromate transporter
VTSTLIAIGLIFSQLSLLAFGGGNTILPEMQRQVVDVHQWMTAETFGALFALGQAAPGPNLMIVPLVGWHVAGWQGLLVASLAKFGPSSLVTAIGVGVWERFRARPWRRLIQTAIFPITAGLVAASAAIITEASAHTWKLGGVSLFCAVLAVKTKLHPLWLLLGGGLMGMAFGNF